MKIDELKKAIRGLIREEVKKVVAEEVNRAMSKVLVEMVKEIKSNNPAPSIVNNNGGEREDYTEREIEKLEEDVSPDGPILQTKNSKLNGVLAETARHFRPNQKTMDAAVGLAELMGGGFDKIGQNESVGTIPHSTKLDFLKQMVSSGPTVMNQPSALDGGSEVPDVLKKVFKKDFRAIMKRIDEQKNGTAGGGYIDPSKVIMNG